MFTTIALFAVPAIITTGEIITAAEGVTTVCTAVLGVASVARLFSHKSR